MIPFLEWFAAFADKHWFLAFVLALSLFNVIKLTFLILNRLIRSINIALRGWPPSHLDADGDWKRGVTK